MAVNVVKILRSGAVQIHRDAAWTESKERIRIAQAPTFKYRGRRGQEAGSFDGTEVENIGIIARAADQSIFTRPGENRIIAIRAIEKSGAAEMRSIEPVVPCPADQKRSPDIAERVLLVGA